MLEKSEALSSTYRHFLLFHFLQLVHPVANINPAASTRVLDYWVCWILLRGYLVQRFTIPFENLAGVSCSNASWEHRCVGPDGNISDREEVMLRVVVRIDVYFTCGNKYEGRIDVNGKFNVSIFISVYLELSLLFCGLIEGFVLFLFILDLLFDSLVDLTKPLGTSKNLSLG